MRSVSLVVWLLVSSAGVAAINLITVPQEIQIGKEADKQLRGQMRVLKDRETATYIRSIGTRLARSAPGPAYPYTFAVADYRELNAFALPGGPVWVHRGVLHAAATESQLAGVVAHEIAHIAQRHAANRLTAATLTNMGLGLLGAMLGNSGGAATAQSAAGVVANGAFLKFSRDDEREADKVGLAMMVRAGWSGHGMVELFETLRREEKRDPTSVEVFFSSHPSPQDRIQSLRAAAATSKAGRRDIEQFQQIKSRLRKLPPPARLRPR